MWSGQPSEDPNTHSVAIGGMHKLKTSETQVEITECCQNDNVRVPSPNSRWKVGRGAQYAGAEL